MQSPHNKVIEEYRRGGFSKVAEDNWNEDNIKGYKECQNDSESFLLQSLNDCRTQTLQEVEEKIDWMKNKLGKEQYDPENSRDDAINFGEEKGYKSALEDIKNIVVGLKEVKSLLK